MEYFFIMLITLIYYIIGFFVVWRISKRTKKKWVVGPLIFIVAVLPIWDWLLGIIVYYPACLIVPKVAVYETAETDGIYYEGEHDYIYELEKQTNDQPLSERLYVGGTSFILYRGYEFIESKVTEKENRVSSDRKSIPSAYYQCTPLPGREKRTNSLATNCIEIERPISLYLVRVTKIKLGTAEINTKKIIRRPTGKLMAEYRITIRRLQGTPWYWIYKPSGNPGNIECPKGYASYNEFEDRVIRPNKKVLHRR